MFGAEEKRYQFNLERIVPGLKCGYIIQAVGLVQ